MEHYFILNLFLVVTMLSVCYSTEGQGYKSLDYPTRGFYNYPWRRFNHLKRMETGVERNEMALDGEVLWGDVMNDTDTPIFYRNELPKDYEELKSKKSSTNKRRLNNVTPGYGIKLLYVRVPGTVMVLPSTV